MRTKPNNEEKMRRIQSGEEVDVNDVEVPNDRYKPFSVIAVE